MTERAFISELVDPPTHQRTVRLAHQQGRILKQHEIDRFADLGISALDLARPWPVLGDRVVFEGDFFLFADDVGVKGDGVFTFVVISNAGFIDIAAWHPKSNRLAVWFGHAFALGERQIHHPNALTTGLPVFRSPIGWLGGGRRGIVIVRASFAAAALASVPVLVAEDEQHQRDLQTLFPAGGPRPKIIVSEPTIKTKLTDMVPA